MFTFRMRGGAGRTAPAHRGARLDLESLESRQLPSGFGATSLFTPALTGSQSADAQVQVVAQSPGGLDLGGSASAMNRFVADEVSTINRLVDSYLHLLNSYEKYVGHVLDSLMDQLTGQTPNLAGVQFQMPQEGFNWTLTIASHDRANGTFAGTFAIADNTYPVAGQMTWEGDQYHYHFSFNTSSTGDGYQWTLDGLIFISPGSEAGGWYAGNLVVTYTMNGEGTGSGYQVAP